MPPQQRIEQAQLHGVLPGLRRGPSPGVPAPVPEPGPIAEELTISSAICLLTTHDDTSMPSLTGEVSRPSGLADDAMAVDGTSTTGNMIQNVAAEGEVPP